MAATGQLEKGFKLYMSTDGTAYTQLVDILTRGDIAAGTRPQVDITPLDSTEDAREKLAGMRDSGEFSFSQLYTAARFSALKAQDGVNIWWRATVNDFATTPSKWEWRGSLSQVAMAGTGNPDDRRIINGTVVVNGSVTFTAGSA